MKSKGPTPSFEARLPFEACLLLREFSHRINNEFASAVHVIAIAARSAKCRDGATRWIDWPLWRRS